jgi:ribosomal protein S18 acetylase RimI-like enzyme
MNNVIIRKATLEDLSTIQELNNFLFKLEKEKYDPTLVNDWPLSEEGKEYFLDLINNHYVIVALLDNNIVGYLAGSIEEKCSYVEVQFGEINNMLVKDEYRGYGIGKSLIDNFKEYCRIKDILNIKVVSSYKNKNAIEFYRKNGFEEFDITLTTKI